MPLLHYMITKGDKVRIKVEGIDHLVEAMVLDPMDLSDFDGEVLYWMEYEIHGNVHVTVVREDSIMDLIPVNNCVCGAFTANAGGGHAYYCPLFKPY